MLPAPSDKPRARDLGIPFEGEPGPWNAITDVAGVEVGHTTLISGEGARVRGQGPVRTGVTAVLPLGKKRDSRVPAAWFSLNGAGEMTGTAWIDESGCLDGPVLLTNTHSVGVARDAVVEWQLPTLELSGGFSLPVVAETWDGMLNDPNGFHVRKEHVFQALDVAASGPVAEGSVGGGTGMIAHRFKGGIGTASRRLAEARGGFTLGVLVQANYGTREQLRISGVPVGLEIPDLLPTREPVKDGSIIVVAATDAPLLPHQLRRIAKRVPLGLGRLGSTCGNSSGDLFLAFSTALPRDLGAGRQAWEALANDRMDPLFDAAVQATEEAIVNALVAAETMTGANGVTVHALPHDRLREALRKYGRLATEPVP